MKKARNNYGELVDALMKRELESRTVKDHIARAQAKWDALCKENLDTLRDRGPARDDAWGLPRIEVYVVQGRSIATPWTILEQRRTEGQLIWQPPIYEILKDLNEHGIPAYYEPTLVD